MRQKPINTEKNNVFRCLTTHPYGYYHDVIPGFKRRCNRESAVMVIYEKTD